MGWMKLIEAAVKTVVVLPVAATKDMLTGDWLEIGGSESSIKKTVQSIKEDIDEIGGE